MKNEKQLFDDTIAILMNGIYPTLTFKTINDYILTINGFIKNDSHSINKEEIEPILKEVTTIIINGIYPSHTFLTINTILNKLRNYYGTNME